MALVERRIKSVEQGVDSKKDQRRKLKPVVAIQCRIHAHIEHVLSLRPVYLSVPECPSPTRHMTLGFERVVGNVFRKACISSQDFLCQSDPGQDFRESLTPTKALCPV